MTAGTVLDASPRTVGIVGGLGSLASADLFSKLIAACERDGLTDRVNVLFEQRRLREPQRPDAEDYDPGSRKLYAYDLMREFERRGVGLALLPCFVSHTFLDELVPELAVPVVDMMQALRDAVDALVSRPQRLGVLASPYVRKRRLFERYFESAGYDLVHLDPDAQRLLLSGIYAPGGLRSGAADDVVLGRISAACRSLAERGAELLLPGITELALVADRVDVGVPLLDCNALYARHALHTVSQHTMRERRIGIVGGVGPAATVDFMSKIVRHTAARRDQDHIKLIVQQNPQIPDRTEHLVGEGSDPTIALYATCKRLEADGADFIAIPCNTAHAFVDRIQRHFAVPIVNMLDEAARFVRERFGTERTVGLAATSGTVASRVYHDAFAREGLRLVVPAAPDQARVMNAIYGERGVKAGFTAGEPLDELLAVFEHLVRDQGANVLILGCTELPLLIGQDEATSVAGKTVPVLDPTEILAKRCIALARSQAAYAPARATRFDAL